MIDRTATLTLFSSWVLGIALLCNASASGQVVRLHPARPIAPQIAGGSFSISATPSSINFVLIHMGQATASGPVSIVSTLSLSAVSNVSLYGYFSSSNALSTASGDVILASSVFGRDPSGAHTTYTPFTQTNPFGASNGLLIYQLTNLASLNGTRNDALYLMIDTSAEPQLAAGSYVGTLILQAQAF